MTVQLWLILDLVVFMLCMEHSEVVCRRQNGELMVYSKPCTTYLMSPIQKEKSTKISLGIRFFYCLSVDTDGLKTSCRALDVWPNIAKYVNETLKKPKSKIPGSSSFTTLGTAVQDGLVVVKLWFFSSTATIMLPYLQKHQQNAPLVPFITT